MSVSQKIMKIRKSAGNIGTTCPICCRSVDDPYRRIVEGTIVEGCVDASHTDHINRLGPCNTAAWHNRPVAKKLRKDTLLYLHKAGGRR